jgi:LacI family transcriptional regulator
MAEPAYSRVTIREVAEEAGVSIATVSRVLNGRDDVAPETRELVSQIIRDRGYIANRSARGLSAGKTGLVGLLVPLVYPVYFSAILSGASEALHENDQRVVLSPTGHEHAREVTLIDRLMHGLTDGALIVLPEESSEELTRLLDGGYRFVVVDPRLPLDERIPSVSAAHASGADQAMRHLLGLGHRRIAAITGPRGWVATEDRRRGYHAALAGAGILPDPGLEVESDFEITGGREAAGKLLDLAEPPTAILAFNDNLAIAHHRPAAVGGDGPHGGEPAHAPAREPADRDTAHRARHPARRARLDRAAYVVTPVPGTGLSRYGSKGRESGTLVRENI